MALYTFAGGIDGTQPTGGLAGDATALYGTTRGGGTADKGTIYRLIPPGSGAGPWTKTVLHDFRGTEGAGPNSQLIAKNGILYGGTAYGVRSAWERSTG